MVKLQVANPSRSNVAQVSSSMTTIATQMGGGLPVIKLLQQGIELHLSLAIGPKITNLSNHSQGIIFFVKEPMKSCRLGICTL